MEVGRDGREEWMKCSFLSSLIQLWPLLITNVLML